MNLATVLVLLLVAVAVLFAFLAMRRDRKAPAPAGGAPIAGSTARRDSSARSGCCSCAGCSFRDLCRK